MFCCSAHQKSQFDIPRSTQTHTPNHTLQAIWKHQSEYTSCLWTVRGNQSTLRKLTKHRENMKRLGPWSPRGESWLKSKKDIKLHHFSRYTSFVVYMLLLNSSRVKFFLCLYEFPLIFLASSHLPAS